MEDAFYSLLIAITDLGDSAVLTALVAAVCICLLAQGCRREALIVLGTFLATTVFISAAKILVMGCGSRLRELGLHSPSGHSALSFAVYGCFAFLLRNRMQGKNRNLPLYLLFPLASAIAASRLMLRAHTASEVCVGVIIGCIVLIISSSLLKKQTPRPVNIYLLVYVSFIVAFLMHGLRLPAESLIGLFADHFRHMAHCA